MRKPSPQPSAPIWIQVVGLCLIVLLIGFFIYAYFNTPNPTIAQSDMVRLLYTLLAGFAASFISGGILLFIDVPISGKARLALSASAGLAIFIFVYLYPPYWYRVGHNEPSVVPSSTATPTNSPAPIAAAKPSPVASTPGVTVTPVVTLSATPTPFSTGQPVPITQSTSQMPPTQVSSVAKTGRVLLLIEEETVLQTMLKKIANYGLRATSSEELGQAESARIRQALPQLHAGNLSAGATIPFAVIVTGKIANVPMGEAQGAYLVEATATLAATVSANGEVIRESVTARGGGQGRETALQRALREVATDIPEIFFRRIANRAQ